MKMFWIVYSGPAPRRVADALDRLGAPGWTRVDGAHGAGTHGRIEGTRAWPGAETLFMAVVPPERVAAVADGLARELDRLEPGERMHLALLPVERFH